MRPRRSVHILAGFCPFPAYLCEDGALVIDPDVVGAGDERDDLFWLRLGIEHHGGVRTRFAVPCTEVRLALEVDALIALATVDYLREPRS